MDKRVVLDTTFLIDLQRKKTRERAASFLKTNPQTTLAISAITLGEFAEGFASEEDPHLLFAKAAYEILLIDEETSMHYARITRALRAKGNLIGTNDLWIAASALRHSCPIVTANQMHFSRVNGLQVLGYR